MSMKSGGKVTARQVLQQLVGEFYFPEGVQDSEEQLVEKIEGIFVYALNAKIRDPKTGEIVGRARDRKTQKPAAPVVDPVRAKKDARRKQRQTERQKARSEQNGQLDRIESGNTDHP